MHSGDKGFYLGDPRDINRSLFSVRVDLVASKSRIIGQFRDRFGFGRPRLPIGLQFDSAE